jgi:glucoamylase
MESLARWIDAQYRRAAAGMLASISPTGLVKTRPGFGQTIRPARGAIVASPVLADYDPDPDYFFHWFRDSAIVIDALRLLVQDASIGAEALVHFGDFVRFSRSLCGLDGRALAAEHGWRDKVAPEFAQYLRPGAELAAVHGEAVSAEARVNPDGTLDISRWARPQNDGPALRALALLRWMNGVALDAGTGVQAAALLRADLEFALHRWNGPSVDLWEEEEGEHYYTLCVSAAALHDGAGWLEAQDDGQRAAACRGATAAIRSRLDRFWSAEAGHYRSRDPGPGRRTAKDLDISVILAAIHAAGRGTAHSVDDPRMQATLGRLEALFDAEYPINRHRGAGVGPAMGRYAGDVYYSGGAYYFSTLGAAEFCYRAAAGAAVGAAARAWIERGDAFVAMVRRYTPAGGELSEQFDRRTGAQNSARHLAWSYASYISCVAARRAVVAPERSTRSHDRESL